MFHMWGVLLTAPGAVQRSSASEEERLCEQKVDGLNPEARGGESVWEKRTSVFY